MITARAFSAAVLSMLFLLGSLGVSGTAIWKETSTDFPSGQNLGTATEGQYLVLGGDPSLPGNWTMRSDLPGPLPRAGHLMVQDDAAGHNILFGGTAAGRHFNDTWSYDAGRDRWTLVETSDAPSPREGPAMAFSTAGNMAVLFGGNDGTDRNDTWACLPADDLWRQESPADPPSPRSGAAMAFDGNAGSVVLFGGVAAGDPETFLRDTWTYDALAKAWTNVTPASSPVARTGHAMAFDPVHGLMVLFGGRNESTFLPDTWTFNATANVWANRAPPTNPPPRTGHSFAYDAGSGKIILFGGQDSSRSYNDTWAYDLSDNTWTRKLLAAGPSSRSGQAMTADTKTGRLVLFGGRDGSGNVQGDTWWYDPASNAWSGRDRPEAPPPRVHHALAQYGPGQATLLFGGTDTVTQFNDTWLYNSSQNIWRRVLTAEAPSPRHDHALACDGPAGTALLFGGLAGSEYQNDTWTYNFSTGAWMRELSADAPRPGAGYLLAFDSYVGSYVLFGGRNDTDIFDETWVYDPALATWTNLTGSSSPPARDDGMMAYDSTRFRMVLFGGSDVFGPLADTWTYFLVSNSWVQMDPAVHPPGRTDGAMAFDSVSRKVVLFGGLDGQPGFNDTWAYSILDDAWTDITPPVSPPSRFGHDLVFDQRNGLLVLFGGLSGGLCRAQTWVLGLEGRYASGTYLSLACATGGSAYFGTLQLDSSAPAGTSLRLQLRGAMTEDGLQDAPFLGPDGTPSSFYTASNTRLPAAHNGTSFVQYCATLESADNQATPRLKSVTLSYNLLHNLRLDSPAGGENWTGIRNIDWEVNDTDGDRISVDLYLLDSLGSSPLAIGIPAGDGTFSWDTNEAPNGTYRIKAVARDDNALIPLTAEAVSAEFTLSHPPGGPPPPPINHPPMVLLSYPADGSVVNSLSTRLIWNATDPDGDDLTGSVLLEVARFDVTLPPAPYCVTSAQHLDITNLTNGQTYYWSVMVSDGRDNGTTEVRQFTVRLGPVNLPPSITSVPPEEATVGVEYVYQVWASDPEGDRMTYSLSRAPAGMVINASSGRIAWTPGTGQIGGFGVTVNVSDTRLGHDSQSYNITVRAPPSVPSSVTILHPTDGWRVRGDLRITGLAQNGTAPVLSVQVRIDGGQWLLANGTTSWTYGLGTAHMPNGRHRIEARCFDGNGYSEIAGVSFGLSNPEPEPALVDSADGYIVLVLWVLAGFPLFWHLRRYPESSPPIS